MFGNAAHNVNESRSVQQSLATTAMDSVMKTPVLRWNACKPSYPHTFLHATLIISAYIGVELLEHMIDQQHFRFEVGMNPRPDARSFQRDLGRGAAA